MKPVSEKQSEISTMTEENIKEVLTSVKKGSLSVDDGLKKLKHLPFEDVGFARIDHHRTLRQGFPEVIFGRGRPSARFRALLNACWPISRTS